MLQVKDGDLDKLGLLFERHNKSLFGFFYKKTFQPDVSEDLVQSVFERMLKYRNSYSGTGTFTTWMFTIARNAHIDYYRQNKKHDEIEEFNEAIVTDYSTENVNESDHESRKNLLKIALSKLDEDKKEVVILSRFEGLKYSEIAQIQGVSESAIKVRFFRAMKDLKSTLAVLNEE